MRLGRFDRFAPLFGAAYTAIFALGILLGDTPDSDAPGQEVISYFEDSGETFASIFASLVLALLFLFFAGVLRDRLERAGGAPRWLASVVFAGAVVHAIGFAIFAMGSFMMIEAANVGDPEVARTLNVFNENNFFPALIGLTTVLLASAWHILQSRVLPSWLGWAALGIGVLSLAGPLGFIAFLLFPLWVLMVSIYLYRGTSAGEVGHDSTTTAVDPRGA